MSLIPPYVISHFTAGIIQGMLYTCMTLGSMESSDACHYIYMLFCPWAHTVFIDDLRKLLCGAEARRAAVVCTLLKR